MDNSLENIPVQLSNGSKIMVQATILGGEEDVAFCAMNFDEIAVSIEGIVETIGNALKKVKPDKATIEFGIEVGVESGKLTAVILQGSGKANLKIALEWSGDNK